MEEEVLKKTIDEIKKFVIEEKQACPIFTLVMIISILFLRSSLIKTWL